jgi:WD40 repeat protein
VLAFDARLERYARSDERGNLSVRSVADDQELALLQGPGHYAYFLHFSPDGRFLAAIYDQHVPGLYVWDWRRRQTILRSHLFGYVDFSPDSRQLVLGEQGSIRFFDLMSGKEVKRIASKSHYHAFAFDPSGRRLAVICHAAPRNVQIYDLDSWKVVTTLSHTEDLDHPSWSPDGHFLVATSPDRCLCVWDVRTGKQQAVLRGHESPPTSATFSHTGDLLASTGWDGTLRLWEPMTGRLLLTVPGGSGALKPCFSPDDRLLGCTTTASEVELWEVGTSATCRVLHAPLTDGEIHSTAFSRDGLILASGSSGGVRLWDGQSGREVARLPIGETRSVLFHPEDGNLFTSGSRGVYRWPLAADWDSPHDVRIGPPRQLVTALDTWEIALSSDGRSLAVVDRRQARALVLNPAGGAQVQLGPHLQIARTAISPDGRWVATATFWGKESTIKVWDAISGQLVRDLPGWGKNGDARVAFSPDGRWLVSAAHDYRFYEVGSWQPGPTQPRERANISTSPLAFAPDSKILAILQNPRLVQLIDVGTGQELARLTSPDPPLISHLAFSPDGSRLAVALRAGVIQVWDLSYLRHQLADLGLDWDLPPYPPLDKKEEAPFRATVDLGKLAPALNPPAQSETDKLREEVEKQSQAIAKNPNDAEAYFQRGRLYLRLKEFPKARDDFDRVIALKPDHFEAHHHRGHAHEGLGQAQKAIDDFSSALRGQPQNAHLYHMRAAETTCGSKSTRRRWRT